MRDRLRAVREAIARSCDAVGRDPAGVTLVAVSKTFPADAIREAYDLGVRDFGENRLPEAQDKIDRLPRDLVSDCTWHFIGKLQSRKVRAAAELFDVFHTLESDSQLREFAKLERKRDALVEVNIAEEPQKAGVLPWDLDEFLAQALYCERVRVRGLMAMGPALDDEEAMRPFFRRLRLLSERLSEGAWLSMGMSSDFGAAIQEGSTHVRIGSALFGERR
ncbi:MAG: YggS family pyridoxal phosphate-dependent enzyme [Fimbriimonadaceae bacterium]|nr:YggS family pyridoxal phosphate-dependent enzyme [Fimbriimonadaceae bacterium]